MSLTDFMFFITTKEIIMTGKKRGNVQMKRTTDAAASRKNTVSVKASVKASAALIGAAVLVACGGTDTVSGPVANSNPCF